MNDEILPILSLNDDLQTSDAVTCICKKGCKPFVVIHTYTHMSIINIINYFCMKVGCMTCLPVPIYANRYGM
jgi:hypothetical protein